MISRLTGAESCRWILRRHLGAHILKAVSGDTCSRMAAGFRVGPQYGRPWGMWGRPAYYYGRPSMGAALWGPARSQQHLHRQAWWAINAGLCELLYQGNRFPPLRWLVR